MSASGHDCPSVGQGTHLHSAFLRLAELAGALDSERVRAEASACAQRAVEGRFFVACVGQFKRGKSTLLNALLGDRILPAGILPLTAVPTVVRYGASKQARVRFEGGDWKEVPPDQLAEFVSEEMNPENRKRVIGAEVFFPSRLLAQGMCLVDTPGLGSVFHGNTEATQAFIPHIDAAIVVLGADPPIAGDELSFVEQIGKQVANLIVVLNKADKAFDYECRIAKDFALEILEKRLGRNIGPIFEVSAEECLENQAETRQWDLFVNALLRLVMESGGDLVQQGAERNFSRLKAELLMIVGEERDALLRPIEESELRMRKLGQTISAAEQSLHDLSYLFNAEEHRLAELFRAHRKEFLAVSAPTIEAEFKTRVTTLPRRFGPSFRRRALQLAQSIAERHVRPWLQIEEAAAELEYRKVAARFADIGNDFLAKLSESRIPELRQIPNALSSDLGFEASSLFTFEELIHVARPASPLRYIADASLGVVHAWRTIENDGWAFLEYLMEMNSARVQSDVVTRVQESRRQLERRIRNLLREVTQTAERALNRARSAKAEGASAVTASLKCLDQVESDLRGLSDRLNADR